MGRPKYLKGINPILQFRYSNAIVMKGVRGYFPNTGALFFYTKPLTFLSTKRTRKGLEDVHV